MTISDASPNQSKPKQKARLKGRNNLLQYLGYFVGVGGIVFIVQSGEPKQIKNAVLAGVISAGSVVSRDWYKARLAPDMAEDPSGFIGLFSEMLHAGRAQANTNAAQMKRVEFLQTDLIEAMRDFNNLLRLDPDEVEQRLKAIQITNLSSALPPITVPNPLSENALNNGMEVPTPAEASTHVPDSTTVRQSQVIRRPGFDA